MQWIAVGAVLMSLQSLVVAWPGEQEETVSSKSNLENELSYQESEALMKEQDLQSVTAS